MPRNERFLKEPKGSRLETDNSFSFFTVSGVRSWLSRQLEYVVHPPPHPSVNQWIVDRTYEETVKFDEKKVSKIFEEIKLVKWSIK